MTERALSFGAVASTYETFRPGHPYYAGYLSTVSAHLELPEPARHAVFAGCLSSLPPRVDVVADITANLARLG